MNQSFIRRAALSVAALTALSGCDSLGNALLGGCCGGPVHGSGNYIREKPYPQKINVSHYFLDEGDKEKNNETASRLCHPKEYSYVGFAMDNSKKYMAIECHSK
jgi:hypothetical protein